MAEEETRALSPISIEAHQDSDTDLVRRLKGIGVPAQRVNGIPVDVVWSIDGKPAMFDLKTASDLIAAVADGRLTEQMKNMQAASEYFGFIMEGEWSRDGVTVGYGQHAWAYERFDNLIVSLQEEGAIIAHASSQGRTAARLASLYRRSGKTNRGSWKRVKPTPTVTEPHHDETWTDQVRMLMCLYRCGEDKANALLDRYSLREILGITDEGLEAAVERWGGVKGIGKGLTSAWEGMLKADFSVKEGMTV